MMLLTLRIAAQVNLQTGSATFSLPVFNWQDDRSRLNTLIALSYNSGSGLKVNDMPSNIGQGWALVCGGAIHRMQNGEPDDQWPKDGTEWDVTKYPAGMLYASVPVAQGCPVALTKYPVYGWKNQLYNQHNIVAEDKQLDYFAFQFNGKAGMFVIDPSNPGYCKSVGDTKLKISFQQDANMINQGIRTRITSFSIQDVDGLIFKFTSKGLVKILKSEFCDANLVQSQRQPKFQSGKVYHQAGFDNGQIVYPWVVNSWYLTEIEDALTQRKIYFNYTTRAISSNAGEDVIFNNEKNYAILFHKKSITQTPELTSVIFPDGHTATLNYGQQRMDLTGDYVLSSIDITYQGRYLSRHELNTSYFILNRYGTPVSDYQKKVSRLCLMSVRKVGPDLAEDTPPYKFDYYTGSNAADDFVPPPFSFAKDNWGYYNGERSRGYWYEFINPSGTTLSGITNSNYVKGLCYLRHDVSGVFLNTKTGYAKNGLLRQIVYPTGGTLTYEYLQNTGILNASSQEVGGVHVSKTSSTDGGFSNGCANPVSTQYSYVLSGGASSLWGLEMPVNSKATTNHYQPEYKYYKWWNCLPFGCCDWKFKYPGIESMQQFSDIKQFEAMLKTLSPVLNTLSVYSTYKDVMAAFAGSPTMLIIDVVLGLAQVAITCIGDQSRNMNSTIYYSSNLNDASPLPSQFKRVEVTESTGGIGKTVQEFTSDDDYGIWEPNNPAFSSKQRFAPWTYGLPKKTTVYDNTGTRIKETENIYNFQTAYFSHCINEHTVRSLLLQKPLGLQSLKCQVEKNSSQRNTIWSDPGVYTTNYQQSSDANMTVDLYNIYTGRAELNKTLERSYKPGNPNDYIESETEFIYNDENYEVSMIKTRKSENGYDDIRQKNIYYSVDLINVHGSCYQPQAAVTNDPAIVSMVQNNMISVPVETSELIFTPVTSQPRYTTNTATLLTTLPNGDIKPLKVLEGRFIQPADHTALYPADATNWGYYFPGPICNPASPDYSFYKTVQTFSYDNGGLLTGIKDEGNRQVVNLYGYSDKYVVASVINADVSTDNPAYTSFEVSGDYGKWVKSGAYGGDNTATAITGRSSYNFATGIKSNQGTKLTSTLNSAKGYTLSFWSTTSTINVSGGATLIKSAPTINGFTYYEYDIPQGASSVNVTGNGTVDELRCYPKAARMRTVTYDPVIGKTDECDENNRITYYEYDKLGRLLFIKDEKKNIVKMYEYNNVSLAKQNGCPGTYYNKLISETFTRNNCGPGYLGGDYTYTVPANSFSSIISQADADAQAEALIIANGQNQANQYGTCTLLYYNTLQSQNFTTESCGVGFVGGTVTYTVPAGRYSTTTSQADANQMALDEIEANGQAYANEPPNANCIADSNPLWIWLEGANWYCANVQGYSEPHLFIYETDINPNSPTYLQTRWSDAGPSDLCPPGTYYNTIQSGVFTRNNCPPGYTGSTVTYTVQPGTYSSTVSQAAANQLAINDVNANGQNYANTYGTCSQGCAPNCEFSPMFKCINNVCETGIRVNTHTYPDQGNYPFWICVFHYEFSDGSWSVTCYESNPDPCY
ncbi:MAG: DUF5977 domain-containing protein [Chitinophagaceae bacterium]